MILVHGPSPGKTTIASWVMFRGFIIFYIPIGQFEICWLSISDITGGPGRPYSSKTGRTQLSAR